MAIVEAILCSPRNFSQDVVPKEAALETKDFANFDIFEGFSDDQLQALLTTLKPERFDFVQNDTLCTVGDKADRLWLITNGLLSIRQKGQDEVTVVTRKGPCVIGEQGLIDDAGERTATIVAIESGTAFVVHRAALETAGDSSVMAHLWRNLARIVSRKLGEATNRRAQLIVQGDKSKSLLNRFVNSHALTSVGDNLTLSEKYADEAVVLWFSDLVGFSAAAREASPSDTATMIRSAMGAQAEIIEAQGG